MKVTLTTQAKYTERSQWSMTGQYVTVHDIYRNDDSSKIFILLQTGTRSADMANMSTNAEDYEMYMTGYNGEKLTNTPKGAIYVFGNTGYMGLYFVDSRGFDPHLYDIVVRNTNVLTDEVDENAQSQYKDVSYKYHNQIHLYANFAGSDAIVKDFLNKDNPTVEDIYAEVVAAIDEGGVRGQLDTDLREMNNYMSLVNQYTDILTGYGIRVPDIPIALQNDAISISEEDTANNPTAFDKSMLNSVGNLIDSSYNTSTESVAKFTCVSSDEAKSEESKLYLKTDYIFPGGCQFNYQSIKLTDKPLDGLKPDDMSFTKWIESKTIEKQTYPTITQALDRSYYNTWYNLDGSTFEYSDDNAIDIDKSIKDAIDAYINAMSDLYMTKYNYQTKHLLSLLKLEASSDTSATMFSINTKDTVLTMYEK